MKKIIFNLATSERRVAIIEQEKVVEFMIERTVENRIVGNIYKGRVVNVLPGMQAAFVDIGRDKNGFLYRDDLLSFQHLDAPEEEKKKRNISELVTKGEEVLVQVTKEGFGTKGPRLTGVVSLPGRYIVYMPEGGYVGVSRRMKSEEERERWRVIGEQFCEGNEGIIVRTSCEGISSEKVEQDIRFLRTVWQDVWKEGKNLKPPALIHQDINLLERIVRDFSFDDVSEIVVDNRVDYQRLQELLAPYPSLREKLQMYRQKENIFAAYGIEQDLEKALRRHVWLKNGAYLIIDQTEALTVIDVNTGKFTGKTDLRDTIVKTNLEAVNEITRQLRLRDIGGIIIIDFIDMRADEDKEKVLSSFKRALEKDRTKTNVVGLTGLGLVEMTRKKVRQNLQDSLSKTCPSCEGKGKVLSDEAQAYRIERLLWEYRSMDDEALLLEVPPNVANVLRGVRNEHLNKLEESFHYKIYLHENVLMNELEFAIRHIGSKAEIEERLERL